MNYAKLDHSIEVEKKAPISCQNFRDLEFERKVHKAPDYCKKSAKNESKPEKVNIKIYLKAPSIFKPGNKSSNEADGLNNNKKGKANGVKDGKARTIDEEISNENIRTESDDRNGTSDKF
ncbi:17130_t:CDS:2 [Dentiscutata erythropus]|uniref:17130_t:CDS:1 n=1 Tax=Dentiscutata erythropus TaxID=1348616 RepID=A0A9N9GUR4_9GLOM|nr:17130_t:CDS:2 [Dentiscutata erythropus]